MKINIEWLSDSWDCDTCGPTWAEGARVYIDGQLVLDLIPTAHCYGGNDYSEQYVYEAILKHLGHEVVTHEN